MPLYKAKYNYNIGVDVTGKAISATAVPNQFFLAHRGRHIRAAIAAYNKANGFV